MLLMATSIRLSQALIALAGAGLVNACTQIPNSFRLAQQEETFSSTQAVNTKLDMLWVIDNSGSMDVSQKAIHQGFKSFAEKYMKPTWDIRVAVITTDTYLAHPAFANHLNSVYYGSGTNSPYLGMKEANGNPARKTPFVNPSWAPNLVSSQGTFTNGVKWKQQFPLWGPNWAKLLPGNHDGPMTTLCWEGSAGFFGGVSQCWIRDDETGNQGPERCAFPGPGEDSTTQCVNTVMNDTVHSGKPIIATLPPEGVSANGAWTQGLVRDFLVNLSVGISGYGRERAFGSILQLLSDNEVEGAAYRFFRPGSLRVIVLVGDEDDQTMVIPSPLPSGFSANTYFSVSYCTSKTIDGYTYKVPECPQPSRLMPVSTVKQKLDDFFIDLDQGAEDSPNYFVVSITPLSGVSIQSLHNDRGTKEVDRADRFLALGDLVGNGSMAMDLTATDYSPMLDQIGQAIVEKKAVFQLNREPTAEEDMLVFVRHADGSVTYLKYDQFTVSGNLLTITDLDFVLSLSVSDQIVINYQPKSVL